MRFVLGLLVLASATARFVLGLLVLASATALATPGDPPPKVDKGQEVLKQLEGQWVLKTATAATPDCIITSVFDNPIGTKPGVRVTKGILEMTMKDEPVPGSSQKLEIGADPECLLMTSVVGAGQTPQLFKCRIKVEGEILTFVQDFSRRDEYPESFDPKKGRDYGRAVTTFVREKPKP